VVGQALRFGKIQYYDAFLEDFLHHPFRVEKGFFQCTALYWEGVSSVAIL